ncbi:MAG TPA: ABC transporter substrate-binding protein, partial [Alphaproteobacteria bacterium]|nr:ABC transporter substrate-binding protein [Alphaproteobacteria bacterium]
MPLLRNWSSIFLASIVNIPFFVKATVTWVLFAALTIARAEPLAEKPLQPGTGPKHAIAMHGEPRLNAGFANLDYADPSAPKGGDLVLGEVGTFDSLNPFNIRGTAALNLQVLVFESLMQRSANEPFTLYGLVAQSIETPADRTWVEFRLNPQARFSDDSPLTADDVIATFETLREKGRPNHRTFYKKVARVERRDQHTVRFVFGPDGNREMPLIMGLMPVLSAKWLADNPVTDIWMRPPLASGPYSIASAVPGREITFVKNPNYWGRDLPVNRGVYNFDRIRIDYYREANAAFEAFKSGQYHVRKEIDAKRWARGYRFASLSDGRVVREELAHGRASGLYGLVFNTRRPPFDDVRVRQALNLALDFEWANTNLYSGQFRRINSAWDNTGLANTEFRSPQGGGPAAMRGNFREAIALLTAAGFRIVQGRMVGPNGLPLDIEVLNTDADLEKLLLLYQRNLDRLGVTLRVRTIDATQMAARRNAFDFDLVPFHFLGTLSPGNEQAFRWGSEAAGTKGSFNYAGLKSADADLAIKRITDAITREELVDATRALDGII